MAVKLLLGPAAGLANVAAAAEQLLSPTNPLIAALEQVRSARHSKGLSPSLQLDSHRIWHEAVLASPSLAVCWNTFQSPGWVKEPQAQAAGATARSTIRPCLSEQAPCAHTYMTPIVGFPFVQTSLLCCAMALQEASVMASLRHPNVTQYLGVCLEPPCLLMEYCSRKSVDSILQAANENPLVSSITSAVVPVVGVLASNAGCRAR